MRSLLLVLSMFAVPLASPHRACAQGDPRKIIERAIQARGEVADRAEVQGVWHKFKGRYYSPADYAFVCERYAQADKTRNSIEIDVQGKKFHVVGVYDGAKGWARFNGSLHEHDESWLKQRRRSDYVDRVTSLRPVLTDKSFSLAVQPDERVEGQPAVGVKVMAKERPDVLLYFDKATGLLVKSQCREIDEDVRREVTSVVHYLDYRELNPAAADEATLKAAKLPSDGPALLDFLRRQVLTDADRKKIEQLVRQLGHDAFQMREKASAGLVGRGAAAIPFLRQAVNSSDLEVARRARECLEQIKVGTGSPVLTATLRLIAFRKPAGAAEALLTYLPFATEEELARETQAALLDVALRDGKPDPVLVKALDDKDPKRRAAAAAALGKDGGAYEKKPGRRILLTGFNRPSKVIYYRDGKKSMDLEEIDVRFYNKLDDKLFAKP